MSDCGYCGHSFEDHCKGGKYHTSAKEDSRMIAVKYRTGTILCGTRHCSNPLCCCVDFIETKGETNAHPVRK